MLVSVIVNVKGVKSVNKITFWQNTVVKCKLYLKVLKSNVLVFCGQ